ncbi:MAG TPA: ATP-binding protein [Acidimicrobiia bacterium]|nr:ATP-binding protein [Acidimicrobiia bacterium]
MKRRLLWSYLSITAFVLLVLEIPLGVSYANSVQRRITSDLQHDAFALAIRTQEPLDSLATSPASLGHLQTLARDYHASAGGRVVIVDAEGHAVADSDRAAALDEVGAAPAFANRPEVAAALGGAQVSGQRWSRTLDADLLYVALPVASADGIQGAVRITFPASVIGDRIREIWLLLAATGGVVLGIVFLVSQLLARSITRPLGDLQGAAGQLGAGHLSVRAEVPRGPVELTDLAESFNATAARLEQLVNAQRGFVADASHQLRTPLAALRLRLEILESDVSGAVADDLDGALAEVERLSRLVDALLALARAEQARSVPVPVSLDDVVAGRCEAWDAFAAERHVRVESVVTGNPWALATPGRLEQVVDNLLNNALEVAPQGSAVRLTASAGIDRVTLVVSDEGPGMTPEERARAFDRFWQSGVARRDGRPNGHFGLGLAIVRELVVGDGGDVTLEPAHVGHEDSPGLAVTVLLRRAIGPSRPPQPAAPPPARQLSTTSG